MMAIHSWFVAVVCSAIYIECAMAPGCGKMENGKWKMENGRWKMGDGKWEMGDGRWEMGGEWKIWISLACIAATGDLFLFLALVHFLSPRTAEEKDYEQD